MLLCPAIRPRSERVRAGRDGLIARFDRVVKADQRVIDERRRVRDAVQIQCEAAGCRIEGEVDLVREYNRQTESPAGRRSR